MMIEDFIRLIDDASVENASEDFWYDVGVDKAQGLLENFSKEDWNLLRNLIKDKPTEWQKRVIYSFDGGNSEEEIAIILDVIRHADRELFEICIDSLRCLTNQETKKYILERPELLEKVKSLSLESTNILQNIYRDFLKKVDD